MKSTRDETSNHHKRNSVYITFHYGRNGVGVSPSRTVHSVKANHSCFDEINRCPDVYFRMNLFRVVLT